MRPRRAVRLVVLSIVGAALSLSSAGGGQIIQPTHQEPDVVYIPSPSFVVDVMLKMAQVTSEDVVYDLGCGDGRIVIEAAKLYGARGVGIDIDRERIAESSANALKEGVDQRVVFRLEDLFQANVHEASVVTLYLLPALNMKIRSKLWRELEPGARVVSHGYHMGDWVPDRIDVVTGHPIYLWTITPEVKRRLASGQ